MPLFLLLLLTACTPKQPADSAHPAADRCAFSFAILTDTHVGEGVEDYGTAGWDDDDDGSTTSGSEAPLAEAVATLNALAEGEDAPAFAVVLGDLTDSGERSELMRARALLDDLALPWLPLLGNHDLWPYAYAAEEGAYAQAAGPTGDALMHEVFEDSFAAAAADLPSLVRAPAVWEPALGADTPFVSFAFTHCGARVVALDSNTRIHAEGGEPGIGPEAALYDAEGAPWPWLLADLTTGPGAEAETVLVLAHHPFTPSTWTSFDQASFERIEGDILEHGLDQRIAAFFGGHLHLELEQEGPAGLPVLLTDATKDGARPKVVTISEEGVVAWNEDR